ncbi:MAG: alanine--tRNA ligase [Parcubacteria group bacterium]|nr:alanine--tRNA ligase [Parcubacteria group bacterium]
MDSQELRRRFLEFFEKRGHAIVPSSSLVPDDPSVLLTTAGMQQFKPYYAELDPETTVHPSIGKPVGLNAASCQKSFRTSDIDEVGDESHLTFFEMLGNFSFGGYFKKEAIAYAYEFLTKEMGLTISFVTVFEGKDSIGVPKDEESIAIWKSLGISDEKIKEQGMEDVFWGPTGNSGPCGPTTEIYCRNGAGQDVEVWNLVFNQYFYPGSREELDKGVVGKKLKPLKKPGVDTGMGLERLAMIAQKKNTIFETNLFSPIMEQLPTAFEERRKRIFVDHIRAFVFLVADGVRPQNKGAGYILRRLARRLMVYDFMGNAGSYRDSDIIGLSMDAMFTKVIEFYGDFYRELKDTKESIISEYHKENNKFRDALYDGLKELERMDVVTTKEAFKLYESFGLPFDVIRELGREKAAHLTIEDFEKEFARHQEISRAGKEKKFGGHGLLLDTGELKAANEEELKIVTRLHTATHLLQAALRRVLGESVHQAGSDITTERTRFDFTFDRKLTDEEVRQTELLVQEAIRENLDMGYKEMPFQEAVALGALYSPKEKYPDVVKVYSAWNPKTGEVFSRELCGGPHVQHTGEVGGFRIGKQEAVSAGVRRIRGHLLKTS